MSPSDSESADSVAETAEQNQESASSKNVETHSSSFKLARVLFGGVLAFTAIDNFRELDDMIAYAESEGAPMADRSVPAISGSLLFGGLGVAAWKLPRLAAGAVATFLVAITPVMHDFWAKEDDQEKEQHMIHFLKNTALLGGALAFLRVAEDE
ncbi:DoxX family protein [Halorussus pelagicus]|uniref:DoxX family protein n=1 Tax=Halorussus pelagicus TaxID=2505977 RepID=UPI000FFC615C|nr:DoxX family protein [Halorussus pelagicus]